ncbi:MAG: hypothetical protein ACRDZT_07090, partial [Acidimicrobiales bacterium]
MESLEYVRVVRRRWPILAVLLLVGLVAGFLTARPATAQPTNTGGASGYQATAILGISSSSADPSGLSLDAMAFLATSGPVPAMTAKQLGDKAGGPDIVGHVQVSPKDQLSVLEVLATESNPT